MLTRRARLEDSVQVKQLLSRVWEDDYVGYLWDDWVAGAGEGVPLVATLEDKVVGVAYVRFIDARVAWFMSLRVDPDHRRNGVGAALSQACMQHARQAGREVARLLIDTDNHASQALTERAGFRRIVTYEKLVKPVVAIDGPVLAQPDLAELPRVLELAREQGYKYWHWDWETHDLQFAAIEATWRDGGFRVLPGQAAQAYLAVSYHDEEVEVYQPVGDLDVLLELLGGVEREAAQRGLTSIEVFLPQDSPFSESFVTRGGLRPVENDGFTIWEYKL